MDRDGMCCASVQKKITDTASPLKVPDHFHDDFRKFQGFEEQVIVYDTPPPDSKRFPFCNQTLFSTRECSTAGVSNQHILPADRRFSAPLLPQPLPSYPAMRRHLCDTSPEWSIHRSTGSLNQCGELSGCGLSFIQAIH